MSRLNDDDATYSNVSYPSGQDEETADVRVVTYHEEAIDETPPEGEVFIEIQTRESDDDRD